MTHCGPHACFSSRESSLVRCVHLLMCCYPQERPRLCRSTAPRRLHSSKLGSIAHEVRPCHCPARMCIVGIFLSTSHVLQTCQTVNLSKSLQHACLVLSGLLLHTVVISLPRSYGIVGSPSKVAFFCITPARHGLDRAPC